MQASLQNVRLNTFWVNVAVCVAYIATARLGLMFALPPDYKATAIWPASGIAFAAMLLVGRKAWPGVFAGAFIGNAWDSFARDLPAEVPIHLLVAAGIAVGSTLQAAVGSAVLHDLMGTIDMFKGLRAASRFVLAVPLICLIAATIGLSSSMLGGLTDWYGFLESWPAWWLGDTVGVLVAAPLVLSWLRAPDRKFDLALVLEGLAIAALVTLVALISFMKLIPYGPFARPIAYIIMPALILAKFRLGPRGATLGMLIVAAIGVYATAHGLGPFVNHEDPSDFISLQLFIGITAATVLFVTGVLADKRGADRLRDATIGELEQALSEIRVLQGIMPVCAWCRKIRTDTGAWQQLETYVAQHTDAQFTHGICPECEAEIERRQAT